MIQIMGLIRFKYVRTTGNNHSNINLALFSKQFGVQATVST